LQEVLFISKIVRKNHSLTKNGIQPLLVHLARGNQRCKLNAVIGVTSIRWASGPAIVIDETSLPPIPTPIAPVGAPPPVEAIDLATSTVSSSTIETIAQVATEPALATYGLCNYTPVGLLQKCLELLHIGLDIPWWGSIVIGELCDRQRVL